MRTLLAIVTGLCLGACSRPESPPPAQPSPAQAPAPTTKDPRAARELIASGAVVVVIDVRTAEEYANGHLSRAIYFHEDHGPEGQATIVTEQRGRLRGRRVVRGREQECSALADAEPDAVRQAGLRS